MMLLAAPVWGCVDLLVPFAHSRPGCLPVGSVTPLRSRAPGTGHQEASACGCARMFDDESSRIVPSKWELRLTWPWWKKGFLMLS